MCINPKINAPHQEVIEIAPHANAIRLIADPSTSPKAIDVSFGVTTKFNTIPLIIMIATTDILVKNFDDIEYLSISERKRKNPDKTIIPIPNQIIFDKACRIDASFFVILKSFKNLKKRMSEISAPPKPKTTPAKCAPTK